MFQDEFDRRSSSSLEEKKSDKNSDFQAKTVNLTEFQSMLQTADTLLQKNQIKEAIKIYEQSLNQAESVLNHEDFKNYFQKTLKDLNIYYVKLMNRRNEESCPLPSHYQNTLQQTLLKADETLKASNIKEALSMYDLAITQALAIYIKPDFEDFFRTLIKELNIYAIKLLNAENDSACLQILTKCDQWTQPGMFGNHPDLRVFIYNHFGCYYRRMENLELALSFLMKALKLLNVSQNEHYLGLTHMNIAAVLSHLGDHANAKNHSLLSVKSILQAIRRKKTEKAESSQELVDLAIILAISYHNLGNEEELFQNFDKSHEYFLKSIMELEKYVSSNHPLLLKFKTELTQFQEKYAGQLKNLNSSKFGPKPKKLIYEKEVQSYFPNATMKNRPRSANPNNNLNKKPMGFTQTQNEYIQANNLKQTDFYFIGNKIMRKSKIDPSNTRIKRNNFLDKSVHRNPSTQQEAPKKEDFALENSNISSRSGNEINFLEKKGVLDWDSEGNSGSDSEKIKKNRVNFLEELAKTQKSPDIMKPDSNQKTQGIPSEKGKQSEANEHLAKKTMEPPKNPNNSASKLNDSNQNSSRNNNYKTPTPPPINPIILEQEKEALSKISEEKQQKTSELSELSKRGKTLEKKLEDLTKLISLKSQEIKSLESEENRKSKLLYDQDKEILKKVQELQVLEARMADLQKNLTNLNLSPESKKSHYINSPTRALPSELDILKIIQIQRIVKKRLHFFNLARLKTHRILTKPTWTLFPSFEKNQYTKNLLKAQRKVKFAVYLIKPSKLLVFSVFSPKPSISVFEHYIDIKEALKQWGNDLAPLQDLLPEINNNLVILEDKRLCLEEFLIFNKEKHGRVLSICNGKFNLHFVNPLHSAVRPAKEQKKGPDSYELETQISENRRRLEEMKKLEELAKLEDERKRLEAEVLQRKEEKLREMKKLEEQKRQEEKEAILAKKELEKRKREHEKAIKLQRFFRKKLAYRKLELDTRVTQLHKRKKAFFKGRSVWIKLFSRKHDHKRENFAGITVFDAQNHIFLKKNIKISESLLKQLISDFKNSSAYFSISFLRKDVSLKNMTLIANSICKLEALILQIKRKLQIEEFRLGFESISQEANRNVFSKGKKGPKTVESEEMKKGPIKKEMSTVKEEIEEEEASPQLGKNKKETRKSNGFSDPSMTLSKIYDPSDIVKEYLSPLEKQALQRYASFRTTLENFTQRLFVMKLKKSFEKLKKIHTSTLEKMGSLEKRGTTKSMRASQEKSIKDPSIIARFDVADNNNQIHDLEARFLEGRGEILVSSPRKDVDEARIRVAENKNPETFFNEIKENIVVIQENQGRPKVLIYSSSELQQIAKIQKFANSQKYCTVIPLKLMKSGKDYELRFPKFSAADEAVIFQLVNKSTKAPKNYKLSLTSFNSGLSQKEINESVLNYILERLENDKVMNELVFNENSEKKSKKEPVAELKLFLVNFEKAYRFVFELDSERKRICVFSPDNNNFTVDFALSGDPQTLCQAFVSEISVLFVRGETVFLLNENGAFSASYSFCYKTLGERKLTDNNKNPVVSKVINYEGSLYLMNVNRNKEEFLQEVSMIGKQQESSRLIEIFKGSIAKTLPYEILFFGIDEREMLKLSEPSSLEDKPLLEKFQGLKVSESKSLDINPSDEEMNTAAIKIQTHYKNKKKKNEPKNKELKVSLKTINEENETKNSNDHLLDDSLSNKESSLIQQNLIHAKKEDEVVNMEFDQEMDLAAAKIQKHYRKKKQKKPEQGQKNNKKEKEQPKIQEKPEDDLLTMKPTLEMDQAATKIQKHYKKKKKNAANKDIQEKLEHKTPRIPKKEETPIKEFDEEMDQAAKKIQSHYRKKNKKKQEKKNKNEEEHKPKKNEKPIIKDEISQQFDEEMDKAALTIQKTYRKKKKNQRKTKEKLKIEKDSNPIESMPMDEEMEKAATIIQKKYRKRQNDKNKSPKKQEPVFDPEMDQAARKIQKHYRKKQKKNPEPELTQEIKGIFNEKLKLSSSNYEEEGVIPEQKEFEGMIFDEQMDQAAKIIQQKYRKKKSKGKKKKQEVQTLNKEEVIYEEEQDKAARIIQKRYKKKRNQEKIQKEKPISPSIQPVEKIEPELQAFNMIIDEGMEDAAKLIQKKYRARQAKIKTSDESKNKKADIAKRETEPPKKIVETPKKAVKEALPHKFQEDVDEDINISEEIGEQVSLGDVSQKDIEL